MKSSTTYVSDLTTIGDGTQHMIGYAQNAQAGYIEAPTNAQQQDGVVPLDRLPAQWWNWFLNKATRRFTESEDFLENAVAELDNILDVMGITPDPTSTTQLKTMFSSNYLQQYLPKIAAQASAFSVDGTHENYIPIADNDGNNGHTLVKVPFAPSLVVNTQLVSTAKNITLPSNCPYDGQTIKVVFSNGHQAGSASDHITLNVNNGLAPAPIVSNQNGTLDYLPIHELTAGTYSVLQANTVLEMYYTETGFSGNPAWVIVGNPVVLSSSTYTIYANGNKEVFKRFFDAVSISPNLSVSDNSIYLCGKIAFLNLFIYNDNNSISDGTILGTITDTSLRPTPYSLGFNAVSTLRYAPEPYACSIEINTSGQIILKNNNVNVGEVSLHCSYPIF